MGRKGALIDIDQIVEMYENGWSSNRIADYFSCSTATVISRLRHRGIEIRGKSINRSGGNHDIHRGAHHEEYYVKGHIPMLCLKCTNEFMSFNQVTNRLCQHCRDENAELAATGMTH